LIEKANLTAAVGFEMKMLFSPEGQWALKRL